ncbi:hypothetical protein AVEN_93085-1 [Araneus ventricosus]|uniref:Uncharacterized protein n=1 Tax=Araneus ventricosus TaxID=182803 RepID=A0A4Y2J3D9_ARAVE|nr:hypothetical protein AVEN_93085-1 [Araneus ventricosus]
MAQGKKLNLINVKETAHFIKTFRNSFDNFESGQLITCDSELPGRPVEVSTQDSIEKIRDIMIEERRVKMCEISKIMGISNELIHNVLGEHLHMRKISAR